MYFAVCRHLQMADRCNHYNWRKFITVRCTDLFETKVPYLTLRNAMEKLPEEFVQCHRMYVINLRYVEYFDFVNQIIRLRGCNSGIEIGGTYIYRQMHI